MPARLLINADDFGLTPGINRAIIELHVAGVLRSATLMANGRAFDHAVSLLHAHHNMGVGCHVVLIDGSCVSAPESIPTLLGRDRRTFRSSLLEFTQAAIRRRIDPGEIECETTAQIQRLQHAGIVVTHVDTHKHVHLFPWIAAAVLAGAQRCGVHALRNPFEPAWSSGLAPRSLVRRAQLRLVSGYASSFEGVVSSSGADLVTPAGTLGIAATGTLTAKVLRATLHALQQQTSNESYELCCHPGHPDAELEGVHTRLRSSREIEYNALLEVVPEILRSKNAPELIHYGDLTRSRCSP